MAGNPLIVAGTINVDQNSVVAVAVSRIETSINKEIKILNKQIEKLHNKCSEIDKKISEEKSALINNLIGKKLKAIKRAFVALEKDVDFQIDSYFSKNHDKITCQIFMIVPRCDAINCSARYMIHEFTIDATEKLKKVLEERHALGVEINKIQIRIAELSVYLMKVPTFERQVKAKLAEHALNQTPDGKKVLELLNDIELPELLAEIIK